MVCSFPRPPIERTALSPPWTSPQASSTLIVGDTLASNGRRQRTAVTSSQKFLGNTAESTGSVETSWLSGAASWHSDGLKGKFYTSSAESHSQALLLAHMPYCLLSGAAPSISSPYLSTTVDCPFSPVYINWTSLGPVFQSFCYDLI